jgi:hypothetical protein
LPPLAAAPLTALNAVLLRVDDVATHYEIAHGDGAA